MITAGITKRHAKRNFLTSMTIVLLTASTNTNVRLVFVKTATKPTSGKKKIISSDGPGLGTQRLSVLALPSQTQIYFASRFKLEVIEYLASESRSRPLVDRGHMTTRRG